MRKSILFLLVMALSIGLGAHEFWMEPDRFYYEPSETIRLCFRVGENFEGENWEGNRERMTSLQLYQNSLQDDLTAEMGLEKGDSLELSLADEGTAMFTMESKSKYIFLEPKAFEAYLAEDGLTTAATYRKEHNETDSAGREYYKRSIKSIVQVGEELDRRCTRPTSLPLDIIPEQNPYDTLAADSITFTLYFKGKTIPNQLIKVWNRNKGMTSKWDLNSDVSGKIRFPLKKTGSWMVSSVIMERQVVDSVVWQSYWGSCTWGYTK